MEYYLLTTDVFPHEFADAESVILIGESEADKINVEDLEFCTTLAINNSRSDGTVLKEFSTWWQENTTGEYLLELLTDQIEHLNEERKDHVLRLSHGEWSLKDIFVAYLVGVEESKSYARDIVIESEFKIQ